QSGRVVREVQIRAGGMREAGESSARVSGGDRVTVRVTDVVNLAIGAKGGDCAANLCPEERPAGIGLVPILVARRRNIPARITAIGLIAEFSTIVGGDHDRAVQKLA